MKRNDFCILVIYKCVAGVLVVMLVISFTLPNEKFQAIMPSKQEHPHTHDSTNPAPQSVNIVPVSAATANVSPFYYENQEKNYLSNGGQP